MAGVMHRPSHSSLAPRFSTPRGIPVTPWPGLQPPSHRTAHTIPLPRWAELHPKQTTLKETQTINCLIREKGLTLLSLPQGREQFASPFTKVNHNKSG